MATTPQNSRKIPAGFIDAFADAADEVRLIPIVLQPKAPSTASTAPKKTPHQK